MTTQTLPCQHCTRRGAHCGRTGPKHSTGTTQSQGTPVVPPPVPSGPKAKTVTPANPRDFTVLESAGPAERARVAKKAIRALYPDVRDLSVKRDYCGGILATWTDGPSREQVESDLAHLFVKYEYDPYADYRETYNRLRTSRDHSPEAVAIATARFGLDWGRAPGNEYAGDWRDSSEVQRILHSPMRDLEADQEAAAMAKVLLACTPDPLKAGHAELAHALDGLSVRGTRELAGLDE